MTPDQKHKILEDKARLEIELQEIEAAKLMHEHKADECRRALQRKQVEYDKICDKLYPKKNR